MPITINGSGTITGLAVGGLPDGSVDAGTLASGVGGKILQVVQSTLTDVSVTDTATTWLDVPGTDQAGSGSIFCVKITPTAATSKVLFTATMHYASTTNNVAGVSLYRDSTILLQGDASTNKFRCTSMAYESDDNTNHKVPMQYLDSPNSTSELTYKVMHYTYNTDDFYINRSNRDYAGTSYDYRTASVLTVMEVAA